jgi:hypothetical protein
MGKSTKACPKVKKFYVNLLQRELAWEYMRWFI